MRRVLKAAGLPEHFTPHCLRHTYASLMLQQGESVAYVQRQLGHASIQLTVDTYGKWLPMGNKAAVDRLDATSPAESGSKMVAGEGENLVSSGAGERNRTPNLRFTNQLLGVAQVLEDLGNPFSFLENIAASY